MAHKAEIERKYLVHRDRLPVLGAGTRLVQGYLGLRPTVRVRTEEPAAGERRAYLTVKGPGLVGREEFEYAIPYEEADSLLRLAQWALVRKTRYRLPAEGAPGLEWELDLFEGENDGLAVAEIELPSPIHPFEEPPWLGREVTQDPAYSNAALAQRPFKTWER